MDTAHLRKKNVIWPVDANGMIGSKPSFTGNSINEAKRESRRLQGVSLGHGLVKVDK